MSVSHKYPQTGRRAPRQSQKPGPAVLTSRAAPDPRFLAPQDVPRLQRAMGNQAVSRLLVGLGHGFVQAGPGGGRSAGPRVGGQIQRDLENYTDPTGKPYITGGAGYKNLLRDTETNALYFKSATSTETQWILVQVEPVPGKKSPDGKDPLYRKVPDAQPRIHKVELKAPTTLAEWRTKAEVGTNFVMWPDSRYPHISIPRTQEQDGVLILTRFHYSRSDADPDRTAYLRQGGACVYEGHPPDKRDKRTECDDRADDFLAALGYKERVARR